MTGTTFACATNETVYGVWNTTAGGNSTPALSGSGVGNYFPGEIPLCACDSNVNNKYTSFGSCTSASIATSCGLNTGFYRTLQRGASLIIGFQICTPASIPARDPTAITLEGSNQPASALHLGSTWTLIYSGPSGLATDPGRLACGMPQLFSNSIWYLSYRFLVTSKRGSDSSTWYSDVLFIGY